MSFYGQYQHSLDAKGRVIIPAKYREELGENFMMTHGLDKNIYIYPMERWEKIVERVSQIPMTDKQGRKFVRFLFSNAVSCSADKQGRVVVDSHLRDYAELDKDVTIIGSLDKAEIWDTARFNADCEDVDDDPDIFSAAVSEKYGI